jgi:AcrR family transcriptional regulator
MTENGKVVEKAGRTLRLSEERVRVILQSVYELLAEVGYERLRVDAVAARAHASKATLYRHWPTKAALVIDALQACKAEAHPVPDTGTLRGDLLAALTIMAEDITGADGIAFTSLIVGMHNDQELTKRLLPKLGPNFPPAVAICARAEQRGELRSDYDVGLIDEIVMPMIFIRHYAFGLPVDAAFIKHIVDDILLPLLTHKLKQ